MQLSLSGGIIPLVRTTAHLGVRISSTLSWSDHVSNIIRRVKFKAVLLKHLARRSRSADLVKRLSILLSRLSCVRVCCACLGCMLPTWHHSPRRFQLSIAGAILHVHRRQMQNINVLATIGWPTLAWRRRRQKLSLLRDLLHGGGLPLCAAKFFLPCLLVTVALTLSATRWRYLFRLAVLLVVWSLFFLLLLLCLILCLSLLFLAPPSAHFRLQAVDKFFLPDKFSYGLL